MIPLAEPNIGALEKVNLDQCITDGFVSSVGPFVDAFEAKIKDISGFQYAIATGSGTSALHAALIGVGVQRDDLVLIPDYTFIATANAVHQCGATPYLIDINETDWTLNLDLLRHFLNQTEMSNGRRLDPVTGRYIGAIVPVCTLGWVPDLSGISELGKLYQIPIVLDAAPALGATRQGQSIGAFDIDAAIFSFNGNKTVTSGAGGAIVTNIDCVAHDVKMLTTTAKADGHYLHDRPAFNYRLSNIQAAVGCAQVAQLEEFLATKRRIFRTYMTAFCHLEGCKPFAVTDIRNSGCWFSGFVLTKDSMDAETLCQNLERVGICARPFWRPMHLQPPYKDCPRTSVEVSAGLWRNVVTLPCSTNLSDEEQKTVIQAVKALLA